MKILRAETVTEGWIQRFIKETNRKVEEKNISGKARSLRERIKSKIKVQKQSGLLFLEGADCSQNGVEKPKVESWNSRLLREIP